MWAAAPSGVASDPLEKSVTTLYGVLLARWVAMLAGEANQGDAGPHVGEGLFGVAWLCGGEGF